MWSTLLRASPEETCPWESSEQLLLFPVRPCVRPQARSSNFQRLSPCSCQQGVCHHAAVTAGVIKSEIRNNNKCDFDRYYGRESAYHSIADAIQKRMDVPAKVCTDNVFTDIGSASQKRRMSRLRRLALRFCQSSLPLVQEDRADKKMQRWNFFP